MKLLHLEDEQEFVSQKKLGTNYIQEPGALSEESIGERSMQTGSETCR